MNEFTMAYAVMAAVVAVFWLWTNTKSGKRWIKNL